MTAHRASRPRRVLPTLALTVALLVVPACAAPTVSPDSPAPETPAEVVTGDVAGPLAGWSIRVPAVDMVSTLDTVGLQDNGTIEVPPVETPEQAAVYRFGPLPGEVGPAVALCHVNGAGRPGCGARWSELVAGDRIEVDRADGTTVAFSVDRVEQVPKDQFPTAEVYSDTQGPELRLITCGGALDREARSFVENTIVFASEVRA